MGLSTSSKRSTKKRKSVSQVLQKLSKSGTSTKSKKSHSKISKNIFKLPSFEYPEYTLKKGPMHREFEYDPELTGANRNLKHKEISRRYKSPNLLGTHIFSINTSENSNRPVFSRDVLGKKLLPKSYTKEPKPIIPEKGKQMRLPILCECTVCKKDETRLEDITSEILIKTRDIKAGDGVCKKISPKKVYNYGEKGCGFRSFGQVQDFQKLKDHHRKIGTLFEDMEFPKDLYECSAIGNKRVVWKRPQDIVDSPKMFVEGYCRFDVNQGNLSDCWFLAALANLTLSDAAFVEIVPVDQDFDKQYCGIFHFKIWHYGRWIDVVVDDKLPVDESDNTLIFLKSTVKEEFWSSLLEKAYAKLYGGYAALQLGSMVEAMQDFTGGIAEKIEICDTPAFLLAKILFQAYLRGSYMGCFIYNTYKAEAFQEERLLCGLVKAHAYSITRVAKVPLNSGQEVFLLRLRNPWGHHEWKGPWSDKSKDWNHVSKKQKQKLNLVFKSDGEFWMSLDDFMRFFHVLQMCHLSPDTMSDLELQIKKKWEVEYYEGEWVKGVTAGGRQSKSTFASNPQFTIVLTDVDEDDDEPECKIYIGLIQKSRQKYNHSYNMKIGFYIFKIKDPEQVPTPLDQAFLERNLELFCMFTYSRELAHCMFLTPGTYVIIPCTFEPNKEAEFLLRIFSEHKSHLRQNDNKIGHITLNLPKKQRMLDEKKAKEIFEAGVSVEHLELGWQKLMLLLNKHLPPEMNQKFTRSHCQSMVALLDYDYSGKLGQDEFVILWTQAMHWITAFQKYDTQKKGAVKGFDLRNAFKLVGYSINNHLLNLIMHRFGNLANEIEFNEFVTCSIRIWSFIEKFNTSSKGKPTMTIEMEKWLSEVFYS